MNYQEKVIKKRKIEYGIHSYEKALKTNNFSKIKDLCEKDSRNKKVILNELFHLIEKNCTNKNNKNDKKIIIEKLQQSKISIINDSYLSLIDNIEYLRSDIKNMIKTNKIDNLRNYIIKYDIQNNYINNENFDILIYAIENNSSFEMLKFIITFYNSLNYYIYDNENKIIKTPLLSTFSCNDDSIKKLLLDSGADINYKINNIDISILSLQNKILTIKDLKFLINIKFKFSIDFIKYLITNNKYEFLEIMFKYYWYDNEFILDFLYSKKNKNGISNKELESKIENKNKKLYMIIPFIDFTDYDINVKDERCIPLFINSIYEMNEVVINYFINHGIDLNNIKVDITSELLSSIISLNNPKLNIIVINNKQRLYKYIDEYEYQNLLKAAIEKENIGIVDYLLDYNKDLNFDIYRTYDNALIHAINKKSLLMVECLIKNKIDVNRGDIRYTPLALAITYRNMPIIKYLVTHGADVNNQGIGGCCNTPLVHAICFENIELVKYLVDHGANVNQPGKDSMKPLTYAKTRNNQEIIDYLIEKNAME
ncbi:ankyrin repeat-containing domain protein [Neocallimastix lanati (nom. inval.)]|nr:ankyrin repeat-containing domain protein [Neocallimastix sp. JGI-2020a]